jgi:hypothetical protein
VATARGVACELSNTAESAPPCPSWPCRPHPQVYSVPSAPIAQECWPPAATTCVDQPRAVEPLRRRLAYCVRRITDGIC